MNYAKIIIALWLVYGLIQVIFFRMLESSSLLLVVANTVTTLYFWLIYLISAIYLIVSYTK